MTTEFKNGLWGPSECGPGSSMVNTQAIREQLPLVFRALGVYTVLDAPCGDFNWMRTVKHDGLDSYTGMDLNKEFIDANQKNYGNQSRTFVVGDIINSVLPKVDLIMCRDCLVHLSLQEGLSAVANFVRSGSSYLATTSYWNVSQNIDAKVGGWETQWRKINPELPPYNLGCPVMSIIERGPSCVHGMDDYGKMLSVWSLQGK